MAQSNMISINENVQTVWLYFTFDNRHIIPEGTKVAKEVSKPYNKLQKRKKVEPSLYEKECAFSATFLNHIRRLNFELADVSCTEKIQPACFVMRFMFRRCEIPDSALEQNCVTERKYSALTELANRVWNMKAHNNECYQDSRELPGKRSLNFNFCDPTSGPPKWTLVLDRHIAKLVAS